MNIWYLPAGRPCLVCCFLTFWRRERRQRSAAAVTFHTRYWHCRKRHCDRLHSWRGEARTQERNQEGEKRREKERKKMFCVLFCFSPLDGDISLLLKTKLKFICVSYRQCTTVRPSPPSYSSCHFSTWWTSLRKERLDVGVSRYIGQPRNWNCWTMRYPSCGCRTNAQTVL